MIVKPGSTPSFARREAGGKGYNLYLMSREGLPVPPWIVIGQRVFDLFLTQTSLASLVNTILQEVASGRRPLAVAAADIGKHFAGQCLPTLAAESLEQGLAELGALDVNGALISLRSSAADEDGALYSFAGQLSSFLYVNGYAQVEPLLKRCWASAYSERALSYRIERHMDIFRIRVAVVLQTMIDADKSGVLFTCDPAANDTSRYVVSSVYGVGEGLVSGALDADTFWLDARDGHMERSAIADKREMLKRGHGGECQTVATSLAMRGVASLSGAELSALHALGQKIMSTHSSPQDIEWAIAAGQLYVLQSRPVTGMHHNLTGYPNLWDNSNIVESYAGLTSPLSFTFALKNYHDVYTQFCEILTLPAPVVKDMDSYLRNMLGCIHGRIYYNLYNWYKLVSVLPGFQNNRGFMETMMGVSVSISPELAARISPHPSWHTLRGKLRRTLVGVKFIYYHFRIQSLVDEFLEYFNREYRIFRNHDYTRMSPDQIYAMYLKMDREMLARWKAPIINDFLCMVHFGVLKKLTETWLPDLEPAIQNDLLVGDGGMESAEPTRVLIGMAGYAAARPQLRALIESTESSDLMEALTQSQHADFLEQVHSYIDRFGFRCMNEMKLEGIDLTMDPAYLFICLKNYLQSGTTNPGGHEERQRELRTGAEKRVRGRLHGLKKFIYFWSLKHARKAVKNRENTRFARTRAYGVGRTMFRAMGDHLAGCGILKDAADIFYLSLEEIHGIHGGTLPTHNLSDIAELRKREYAAYRTLEPKTRFQTRGPVYWHNSFLREPDTPDSAPDGEYNLSGLPCCPGIVEGIVRVVKSRHDDLRLNGEILVTTHTDPGWVPLYPSVSGLLVERGSLLSHSAIVAREMGLPAIVGIKGLMSTLHDGMRVRMDAKAGTVKILA